MGGPPRCAAGSPDTTPRTRWIERSWLLGEPSSATTGWTRNATDLRLCLVRGRAGDRLTGDESVEPFPLRTTRHYSVGDARVVVVPVGKPAPDSCPGDRCSMTAENPPLSEAKFLTVVEVAAVMRVSKMTVYRLVHSGELPAIRVGRSFRVPEQAVHDYLRGSFVEAG